MEIQDGTEENAYHKAGNTGGAEAGPLCRSMMKSFDVEPLAFSSDEDGVSSSGS